jgi:uncharacterized membrane protein
MKNIKNKMEKLHSSFRLLLLIKSLCNAFIGYLLHRVVCIGVVRPTKDLREFV